MAKKTVVDHLTFQELEFNDLPGYMAVDRACYGIGSMGREELIRNVFGDGAMHVCIVAKLNSLIIATMLYTVVGEGSIVEIDDIAVLPEYRRLGIAKRMVTDLVQTLERDAQNMPISFYEKTRVWLPETCLPAQMLFKSCGFLATRFIQPGKLTRGQPGHSKEYGTIVMRRIAPSVCECPAELGTS